MSSELIVTNCVVGVGVQLFNKGTHKNTISLSGFQELNLTGWYL